MKTKMIFKKISAFLLSSAVIMTASTLYGISVSAAGITVNSPETLQNAVDSAGTNAATLTLTADITANSSIVIGEGQNITIDLSGFTLGRNLNSPEAKGSVIIVEGGTLTIKDSSPEQKGCITGGSSTDFGGGISCLKKEKIPSSLTLNNITLKDNKASSGGAVYADSGCTVTVSGCTFEGNSAEKGGAVAGMGNVTLDGCTVKNNSAEFCGGGIFQSDGIFTLGGGLTKIKSNTKNDDENNQNDIAFGILSKITVTGQFERSTRIGLSLSDRQTEVTTGYGKNNTVSANNYFFVNNEEYRISPDSKKTEVVIEKDPNSIRNTAKTLVEVYSDGKRISKNEYGTPADAWNKAVNAASSDKETVMTLGGDWVNSEMSEIGSEKHITIDLNGHYIKRDLNYDKKSKGGLFTVKDKAVLTIKDSSPESTGYDGIKGGVLTGGASSDTGGCFEITEKGKVIMNGGTIYDCITDEDGGAVYVEDAPADHKAILFESCIFRGNRADRDGGAFFVCDDGVALSNTEITKNSAKKRGGAVFVDARYGITVRGLVTIDNNTCDDNKSMANLTLENSTFIEAKIMNAGLYKGSHIAIGTTAASGKTYLSNSDFSKYQTRYFSADEGKIDFSKYLVRYSLLTTSASIFGNGNVAVIICFGISALVLTIIIIVVKKKRTHTKAGEGGEKDDQN